MNDGSEIELLRERLMNENNMLRDEIAYMR